MNLQIIEQFSKRTEYKMLREWVTVTERNISEFIAGICVIPAIVLLKLSESDLQRLNEWWKQWGNQLIVLPPFHKIDVGELLQLNVVIAIEEIVEERFKDLPVVEVIKSNSQSIWELDNGDKTAVDIFEHTGSGCVTLTTIPLLDYRLSAKQEVCKTFFLELINTTGNDKTIISQESFSLQPVHEYILILASANVLDSANLSDQLNKFFKHSILQSKAIELFQNLVDEQYLESSGELTDIGKGIITKKSYQVFAREIRKWRHDDDGEW